MGAYDNCIILIPALQPDERLTQMIHGLHERGFHKIAVMDDGSSDDRQKYFQEVEIMGVKVIQSFKKNGKRGSFKWNITDGLAHPLYSVTNVYLK